MRCTITASGEPFAVIILLTQQQESSATCLVMDTAERILVTDILVAVDRFGWTTFDAVEQKQASQTVDTEAGANTAVYIIQMFQFYAFELGWSEVLTNEKVVLKCNIMTPGEPCVMTILMTQMQLLLATCLHMEEWDSRPTLVIARVLLMERFGCRRYKIYLIKSLQR